ncbi:MAG TPA: hypothetical protein VFB27_00040 [Opitutaceae bacterium]|nr:hypothetical protein [Opitutaceae bacterium]
MVSSKSRPWQYIRLGDFEVLSRCTETATRDFVARLFRAYQLFYALVPGNIRVQPTAPTAFILYADDMSVALPPEILLKMRTESLHQIRTPPNFMLIDRDEAEVVVLYPEKTADFELHTDFLNLMIGGRAPPPPRWLLVGFATFYQQVGAVMKTDSAWSQLWASLLSRPEEQAVSVNPLTWISPEISSAIQNDPEFPRRLLPLRELFSDQAQNRATTDSDYAAVWQAEANLFVRWAFDEQHPDRLTAFWKFVERTSAEPPAKEDVFEQCFGFGYSDMLDRLVDYQTAAVANPLQIALGKLPRVPDFRIRLATSSELGRIKGDWERLEARYVRKEWPELARVYLDQARQTLSMAQERDPQNPELSAVLGLCEADAGRAGQSLLEAAVAAGVQRPRLYFELARLRYAEALAVSGGADGRLTAEQAFKISEPLWQGMRLSPAMPEMYGLLGEVWQRCPLPLPPEALAALHRGAGLFPRDAGYALTAASVFAAHGESEEALRLVDQGLKADPDSPVRDRLVQLKASQQATGP